MRKVNMDAFLLKIEYIIDQDQDQDQNQKIIIINFYFS